MLLACFVLALVFLADVNTADAGFTTDKCLVQKRLAWNTLRKCQASADVKLLKRKAADPNKCQTPFREKLAKIADKATKAGIACRYGLNGDSTVTDYDTGLMWETKSGDVGGPCFLLPDVISHCVNFTFEWPEAQAYVHSSATGGPDHSDPVVPFFAGRADWRIPTNFELQGIVDLSAAGCGNGGLCIDTIFGATIATPYWSSTTSAEVPQLAYTVSFSDGAFVRGNKTGSSYAVRAVRGAF